VSKTNRIKARRARELAEARQRAERTRRNRYRLLVGVATIVVLVVVGVVVAVVTRHPTSAADRGSVTHRPVATATGRTVPPPWSAPGDVAAAVHDAGLPMLSAEGTVEHIHAHLDVLDNGRPVTVPAEIGIDATQQQISPVHTHDTTGIIHVESPVRSTFTLGQFFTEWRVSLSAHGIGGLEAGRGNAVRAYVDGKLRSGDPAAIVLHEHDEIALVYGPASRTPQVPGSYQWPAGY
jgi:hypothetical protein